MKMMANPRPCFFQLYLEEKNCHKLPIPPPFLKNFNGRIPNKISLRNLFGRTWPANIRYVGNKLHVTSGWRCYARENLLKTGDFVVFQYLQNSEFLVTVYGTDGCIKPEPLEEVKEDQRARGSGRARGLKFQKAFKAKLKNFVCIPKSILEECDFTLPQDVNLRNEKYCIKAQLRQTKDRVILGYAGVQSFWRMIELKMGDRLEFEVILADDGKMIAEIFVRNLSTPTHTP